MIKKLTRTGNSIALVLDKPPLEEVGLDENAEVEVSTNGVLSEARRRKEADAFRPLMPITLQEEEHRLLMAVACVVSSVTVGRGGPGSVLLGASFDVLDDEVIHPGWIPQGWGGQSQVGDQSVDRISPDERDGLERRLFADEGLPFRQSEGAHQLAVVHAAPGIHVHYRPERRATRVIDVDDELALDE
ncbi:MAG TPA: hypothetical protein VNA69_15775 [Thermoanaerobaculia bacterium]|nr:hypothetical protein [Thermoanaerobaculia bacterium]